MLLALGTIMFVLHTFVLCGTYAAPPIATLDFANATGVRAGGVNKFLGIPYARPPLARLRFRKAQPLSPYMLPIDATAYKPSCVQQKVVTPPNLPSNISSIIATTPFLHDVNGPESEDCLTINVFQPDFNGDPVSFPVIVYIHGGGFETGGSVLYDDLATRIVKRSIELYEPVVFVTINYRLSAYGFLACEEMYDEKEGNLGLLDQRLALSWVQRHIQSFGGDRTRVMLWGESTGATAIALQMVAYGGRAEGLYHSAFMQSGAPIPVGDITGGQKHFEFLVSETGCHNEIDSLECIRYVPLEKLKAVVERTANYFSYESLALPWIPRVDDTLLYDNPSKLVRDGAIAPVPVVSGNCEDEGTIFALSSRNVTSDVDFYDYITQIWFPGATTAELDPLWSHYPPDLVAGSPYATGELNSLTLQFQRVATFIGDAFFQAPRRNLLKNASNKMKVWSFLNKQSKDTPYLGSYHGCDSNSGIMDDYVVNFAYRHDPNNGTGPTWPEYTAGDPLVYTFGSNLSQSPTITRDTFRADGMDYLTELLIAHPF